MNKPNHNTERTQKLESSRERTKASVNLPKKPIENIHKIISRNLATSEKIEKKQSLSTVRPHLKVDESKNLVNSNLFKSVSKVVNEKLSGMTTRHQPPKTQARQARSQSRERSVRATSASKDANSKNRASSLSAFKQNRPDSNFSELSFKRKKSPFTRDANSSSSSLKSKTNSICTTESIKSYMWGP